MKRLMTGLTVIFTVILCCIGYVTVANYKNDASMNLANISNSSFFSPNTSRDVVFYNSTTPQAERIIPMDYMLDKITFSHVQYRDLDNPNNQQLQGLTHDHFGLGKERISFYHNKYSVKSEKMTHSYSPRVVLFIVMYFSLIVLLSCFLALLVAKFCL